MKSLFVCAALAACAWGQDAAEPAAESVTLRVGETKTVILKSNPTTGFAWTLTEPVKVGAPVFVSVELVSDRASCPADEENPCCGAPRDTEVRMTGVHAGAMSFTLQYHRIWEPGVPPIKTRSFVVTVTP